MYSMSSLGNEFPFPSVIICNIRLSSLREIEKAEALGEKVEKEKEEDVCEWEIQNF